MQQIEVKPKRDDMLVGTLDGTTANPKEKNVARLLGRWVLRDADAPVSVTSTQEPGEKGLHRTRLCDYS